MSFPDNAIPLAPCATEDSTNCYYDATQSGNGYGQSFFNYDGYTVLIHVPKGYHVESVLVDPEGIDWGYAGNPGYGVTFRENVAAPTPTQTPEPAETATATTAPSATPSTDPLATTGIDLAPFGWVIAAALAVSLIGLTLIGIHAHKTRKEGKS